MSRGDGLVNHALGLFQDSPRILLDAAAYLISHGKGESA